MTRPRQCTRHFSAEIEVTCRAILYGIHLGLRDVYRIFPNIFLSSRQYYRYYCHNLKHCNVSRRHTSHRHTKHPMPCCVMYSPAVVRIRRARVRLSRFCRRGSPGYDIHQLQNRTAQRMADLSQRRLPGGTAAPLGNHLPRNLGNRPRWLEIRPCRVAGVGDYAIRGRSHHRGRKRGTYKGFHWQSRRRCWVVGARGSRSTGDGVGVFVALCVPVVAGGIVRPPGVLLGGLGVLRCAWRAADLGRTGTVRVASGTCDFAYAKVWWQHKNGYDQKSSSLVGVLAALAKCGLVGGDPEVCIVGPV